MFHDLAWMTVSVGGTGPLTLGTAVPGAQTFAAAGVADQESFSYKIADGTNFETGIATYTASGTTMSRTVLSSSAGGTTPITVSTNATVAIVALAKDLAPLFATSWKQYNPDVTCDNGGSIIANTFYSGGEYMVIGKLVFYSVRAAGGYWQTSQSGNVYLSTPPGLPVANHTVGAVTSGHNNGDTTPMKYRAHSAWDDQYNVPLIAYAVPGSSLIAFQRTDGSSPFNNGGSPAPTGTGFYQTA